MDRGEGIPNDPATEKPNLRGAIQENISLSPTGKKGSGLFFATHGALGGSEIWSNGHGLTIPHGETGAEREISLPTSAIPIKGTLAFIRLGKPAAGLEERVLLYPQGEKENIRLQRFVQELDEKVKELRGVEFHGWDSGEAARRVQGLLTRFSGILSRYTKSGELASGLARSLLQEEIQLDALSEIVRRLDSAPKETVLAAYQANNFHSAFSDATKEKWVFSVWCG